MSPPRFFRILHLLLHQIRHDFTDIDRHSQYILYITIISVKREQYFTFCSLIQQPIVLFRICLDYMLTC
jgi:hypothetical protein